MSVLANLRISKLARNNVFCCDDDNILNKYLQMSPELSKFVRFIVRDYYLRSTEPAHNLYPSNYYLVPESMLNFIKSLSLYHENLIRRYEPNNDFEYLLKDYNMTLEWVAFKLWNLEFLMEEKDRLNELRSRARRLSGLISAINSNNKPARGEMWTRSKPKQDPSAKEEKLIPWEPWEGWHYEQQHPVMHPNTRAMKNDLETRLAAISEELSILERKHRRSTLSTVRQIRLKEPR